MSNGSTVLDSLCQALARAAEYNPNDQVAPAAVLWTDGERRWDALIGGLQKELPHLLTLGSFDPATRTGPAIWIKCMLGRSLPEADWPEGTVPIVYLPGVNRAELRAVAECPPALQPIAELQYRGVIWSQVNSKDWTPLAFLKSSSGGLGLDVAQDQATAEALAHALPRLASLSMAALQGRHIDAAFLNDLLNPDKARRVLTWLGNPAKTRAELTPGGWAAFRSVAKGDFGFDPESDGELKTAELLATQGGPWAVAWQRFAEAPELATGIPELLRRAYPKKKDMFFVAASWPQENDKAENELRAALVALDGSTPDAASTVVLELESKHGPRRNWVWSRLGQAPLAMALEPLAVLAHAVAKPLGGATADEMARHYVADGWKVDAAVVSALEAARASEDLKAVGGAVRALYLPWAGAAAERLQSLWHQGGQGVGEGSIDRAAVDAGSVLLFVDGLRFDLGQALTAGCRERGWAVAVGWRWAPLPSVTPTGKPAAGLLAGRLGAGISSDFVPVAKDSGKPLTGDRFKQLHKEAGVDTLDDSDTGQPSGRAWTECGSVDHFGHDEGVRLAWRVEETAQTVIKRIERLLAAGWKQVHVVTDHGWLILPGGLPKVELPAYLVDSRWGRCAALQASSTVTVPEVSWAWGHEMRIALAPGFSAFAAGLEYAHGGLSVQECVVPELTVRAVQAATAGGVRISSVSWAGLRWKVQADGAPAGCRAALRAKAGDPKAISGPRPLDGDGMASALVGDDQLMGTAAFLVILGEDGALLAQELVTVGG